jgi:hypothetical protein
MIFQPFIWMDWDYRPAEDRAVSMTVAFDIQRFSKSF